MAGHKRHGGEDAYEYGMPIVVDILLTIALTVGLIVLVRTFLLDSYRIPTGSMLETIQLDDLIFGEKISYRFRSPEAGEVITFEDPERPTVTLIKRVIATEGQTVDLVDGRVVVDGVPLDEPYVSGKESWPINDKSPVLDEPISYPYTVPEGHIWVMGDNRTNSLDSRYFGPIPLSSVKSHAILIYWPFEDFGTL